MINSLNGNWVGFFFFGGGEEMLKLVQILIEKTYKLCGNI